VIVKKLFIIVKNLIICFFIKNGEKSVKIGFLVWFSLAVYWQLGPCHQLKGWHWTQIGFNAASRHFCVFQMNVARAPEKGLIPSLMSSPGSYLRLSPSILIRSKIARRHPGRATTIVITPKMYIRNFPPYTIEYENC
jgi:hypothetical protein